MLYQSTNRPALIVLTGIRNIVMLKNSPSNNKLRTTNRVENYYLVKSSTEYIITRLYQIFLQCALYFNLITAFKNV